MSYKTIRTVDYLIVHCADTPPSMDIGVKEIRDWHKQRGWWDVGYHYVIRRDGTLEKGRPDYKPGAHVKGFNRNSLGICLVGGRKAQGKQAEQNFTPEQYISLFNLLSKLQDSHVMAAVIGHRDLDKHKMCPSFDVQKWYGEYNPAADKRV